MEWSRFFESGAVWSSPKHPLSHRHTSFPASGGYSARTLAPSFIERDQPGGAWYIFSWSVRPCSLGLSATRQQYFSLRINQPPATSQQYSSLRRNQHQPSVTSQPNRFRHGSPPHCSPRHSSTSPHYS
jgi:hypothetical protein